MKNRHRIRSWGIIIVALLLVVAVSILGNALWMTSIHTSAAVMRLILCVNCFPQLLLVGVGACILLVSLLYALLLSHRASLILEKEVENQAADLLESENTLVKLRKAVEASGEVIFMTGRDGIITYINPAFTTLYGYHADEVLEQVTPRILKSGMMAPEDYDLLWETLLHKQVVEKEIINRRKDGRLVTIGASANPIMDENGIIIGFLAIQRDITAQKKADAQLKRRNQRLATLNAIATTVSQSLDMNEILNDALDEVLKLDMFGGIAKGMIFRLDEQSGTLSLAVHRGAPKNHPCVLHPPALGTCLCGLVAQQGEMIICKDGWNDPRHGIQWQSMPDHRDICLPLKVRGKVLGVMNMRLPAEQDVAESDVALLTAVADQISIAIENAQLFEAISQQRERLRVLAAQLAETEENERRQLARELHDQVGQNLTALGINLHIISAAVPNERHGDVISRINDSLLLVEQTTERIRDVMSDLRPPMLDDYGLLSALRWYAERLSLRTGLAIHLEGDEKNLPQLSPLTQNTLFRIVQEALTNIIKHAQAENATIRLSATRQSIHLTIADDGIGFKLTRVHNAHNHQQGWGLLIMEERAESANGRLHINTQPSKGTEIVVEIPL